MVAILGFGIIIVEVEAFWTIRDCETLLITEKVDESSQPGHFVYDCQ
jgi:hypothetical protein